MYKFLPPTRGHFFRNKYCAHDLQKIEIYSEFHGFRLRYRDNYSSVNFDHFCSELHFLRQQGQLRKKAQTTISKFSLSKLVKHTVVYSLQHFPCSMFLELANLYNSVRRILAHKCTCRSVYRRLHFRNICHRPDKI